MKNKKVNIFALLFILLLGILLVGCQSSEQVSKEDKNTNDTSATKEEKKADNYPEKNIKFIIPSSAGGGFDTSTRQLQPFFTRSTWNKSCY